MSVLDMEWNQEQGRGKVETKGALCAQKKKSGEEFKSREPFEWFYHWNLCMCQCMCK